MTVREYIAALQALPGTALDMNVWMEVDAGIALAGVPEIDQFTHDPNNGRQFVLIAPAND